MPEPLRLTFTQWNLFYSSCFRRLWNTAGDVVEVALWWAFRTNSEGPQLGEICRFLSLCQFALYIAFSHFESDCWDNTKRKEKKCGIIRSKLTLNTNSIHLNGYKVPASQSVGLNLNTSALCQISLLLYKGFQGEADGHSDRPVEWLHVSLAECESGEGALNVRVLNGGATATRKEGVYPESECWLVALF